MSNPISGYDHGLAHYAFSYISDAGNIFIASIRAAYIDNAVIGATALPPKTETTKPKPLQMRYLILTSVDASPAGTYLKRHVPCNLSDVVNYLGVGKGPQTVTVDGEVWSVTGFHGESWRGAEEGAGGGGGGPLF